MFCFEQQLHIVCVVVVTSRGEAAPEHVEREEEAGPGSAEPAAEEWSRELGRRKHHRISNINIFTYMTVLMFLHIMISCIAFHLLRMIDGFQELCGSNPGGSHQDDDQYTSANFFGGEGAAI